jgi:hypothetical protein
MKKLLLLLALFIIEVNFAQNTYPLTGSAYYDTNVKIGKQESPSGTVGEINRLSLQPFGHTGGPWSFKVRDNASLAFLDLDYGTAGSALTITSDKNIGIGILTPTVKLQVLNSLNTNKNEVIASFMRSGTGTGGSSIVRFGYHNTCDFEVNSGHTNIGYRLGNYFDLNIVNNHAGGAHGGINFATNSSVKMAINVNGNVGIGTIITGTHKLAVEGSIGAREIKVQTTGWSDFVFKKEYNLPTLEEVEKHIAEKGHLENIPSEEEVLKNGINLGEMNAKLLQKIEELTLYMIEMKKDIIILKTK